jgi:hypothetical protein
MESGITELIDTTRALTEQGQRLEVLVRIRQQHPIDLTVVLLGLRVVNTIKERFNLVGLLDYSMDARLA